MVTTIVTARPPIFSFVVARVFPSVSFLSISALALHLWSCPELPWRGKTVAIVVVAVHLDLLDARPDLREGCESGCVSRRAPLGVLPQSHGEALRRNCTCGNSSGCIPARTVGGWGIVKAAECHTCRLACCIMGDEIESARQSVSAAPWLYSSVHPGTRLSAVF